MAIDDKRTSQLPPDYEESAAGSSVAPALPSSLISPAQAMPATTKGSTRWLYYQIFEDGLTSVSQHPAPGLSFSDPSIGRIPARSIAPPRTVSIIKNALFKHEGIALSRLHSSAIYLLAGASGDAAEDSTRVDILDERGRGPGGSPEVPIALVLGKEVEEEVDGAVMSHDEPGKVASKTRPRGWKLGQTVGNGAYLCLAIKPKGGLRWLDGTLPAGRSIYVDPSGLCNHSDWLGSYSMYPVIDQETRLYGFMPVDAIELMPEPTASKGKFPARLKSFFSGSSSSGSK